MKKIIYLLIFVAGLYGCNNATQNNKTEETLKDSSLLAANFDTFLSKFSVDEDYLPATFGEEWLAKRDSLQKIDSVLFKYFIAGDTVLNHEVIANSPEKKVVLSNNQDYYYVSQLSISPAFKTLIVSNLVKDSTITYLLNFTLKGKYMSGMVIQSLYEKNDLKCTRESVVSDSKAVLVREVRSDKGASNKLYNIAETGATID